MKIFFYYLVLVFLFVPPEGVGQKFSPKWYGRAETKTPSSYNSYLCELLLNKKGNQVTGTLNYFFGKQEYIVKVSGQYWPQTRTIELNPFNLITYFSTSESSPDCQMDGSLTLYTEGGDSLLYGQLNPVAKYRNMCPILTIMLRKEVLPDPGPDPDMPESGLSAGKPADTGKITEIILPAESVIQLEADTLRNSVVQPSLKTQPGVQPGALMVTKPQLNNRESNLQVPALNKRTFQQGPLILVDTDTITLHLYDNGQVDNDTVTVFFNRLPVIEKQRLSTTPVILKIALQPGENEIAMFAENLGQIPPNTALCLLYSGEKRYEINLVSNLAINGTIRIKRRDP